MASGGVFGVGLGDGTSKYSWVPNANTDYVFSIIGEELGLIGSVAVLVLFAPVRLSPACGSRGAAPIRSCGSPPGRRRSGSAARRVINIGYVTALLPVTGIPLPFISAGGTSLLVDVLRVRHARLLRPSRTVSRSGAQRATASAPRAG